MQFLSPEQYNQLFTMHGTLMLLMFATPLFFAFGNLIMPLQIGAPDVAFPRLNALSFWLFLFGSTIVVVGLLHPRRRGGLRLDGLRAAVGRRCNSPGVGGNLWMAGLAVSGLGTILGGVNFITTIVCLRAPGHDDVPDADLHLEHDGHQPAGHPGRSRSSPRRCSGCWPTATSALSSTPARTGAPMLWQHLFWFFGHPEVYIIALPFFGIITEIIPVFSRKPLFGYKGMVGATLAIGFLSLAVWAHHMFATGAVLLPFFSFLTYLIAVPTGLKFFNWIGTMWRGQLTFETPMLWSIGFMVTFLLGGLTGVLLASPPLDWHVTDTYFVVAHFHYVVFGTVVFAANAGIAFWFPKMCGRMLDERLGKLQFWMTFIGFHGTFLIQHWLGNEGMPRRYVDYLPTDGFTTLNMISTIFSFVLGASIIPFLYNVVQLVEVRAAGAARRPLGPRQLAGVGHLVAAAAAQLRRDPADPLRAAGVRGALPAPDRAAAGRGARRQGATSPTPDNVVGGRAPARGRARATPTRPETGPPRLAPVAALRAAGRPRRGRRTRRPSSSSAPSPSSASRTTAAASPPL